MSAACSAPVIDETLLAWWVGELEGSEQEEVEAHLLSCDECAGRGRVLAAVGTGVGQLVRKGTLSSIALLPTVVERMQQDGLRIREYRAAPGGSVQCTVSPDDDVVLAWLEAELAGVSRVDVGIRIGDGAEELERDVPFEIAAGAVILAPSSEALKAAPAHVQRVRLLSVGPAGESVLGEYTFNHTPWPAA